MAILLVRFMIDRLLHRRDPFDQEIVTKRMGGGFDY